MAKSGALKIRVTIIMDRIVDLTTENEPLKLVDIGKPAPAAGEVLIEVRACGV